ncbi:hypothetical protein FCULG_00000334 [Fusarium culmorum]|uniref:Uncharacterized protein n=1 Tax=Fusarium culmorum TaxID=5516 RepID=A0A2T4GND3_FUSCU|nr:hypothetical protein FCULG_00000334 [Fusarium culmorum]
MTRAINNNNNNNNNNNDTNSGGRNNNSSSRGTNTDGRSSSNMPLRKPDLSKLRAILMSIVSLSGWTAAG